MRVHVHSPEPERQPAGVGFEDREPELGKPFEDPGKNKVAHGRHVVAGKADGVIDAAQRLEIVNLLPLVQLCSTTRKPLKGWTR